VVRARVARRKHVRDLAEAMALKGSRFGRECCRLKDLDLSKRSERSRSRRPRHGFHQLGQLFWILS
jgi:hypothetical protein